MKYSKVKINGVVYKYQITEDNKLSLKGIVTYPELQKIKERLIKRGIYQENKVTTHKVEYDERYLERRFNKWADIELKLYYEELEEKHKLGTLSSEEKSIVQPVREELKRRGVRND